MDRANAIRVWLKGVNVDNPQHREAVKRALVFLYERQTATEQAWEATKETNNKGFNHADAKRLTSIAKWVMKANHITPKQTALVARRLQKYSGQLAEMPKPN